MSSNLDLASCILSPNENSTGCATVSPIISKWVKGCLEADYTDNKYVESAKLIQSGKYIYFKLKNPIVPFIIETGENDCFYYLTEEQKKVVEDNPAYLVAAIAIQIPDNIDQNVTLCAYMPNNDVYGSSTGDMKGSMHPNVSTQICMGTISHKANIGRLKISDVVELLYVANKRSAYRWFGESDTYKWRGKQLNIAECEKVNRINAK